MLALHRAGLVRELDGDGWIFRWELSEQGESQLRAWADEEIVREVMES
jgi:hypothetical protein